MSQLATPTHTVALAGRVVAATQRVCFLRVFCAAPTRRDHIEFAVSQELSAIEKFAAQHESLYLNGKSMESARCAAGGVLELVEQVMSGKARNGMALVRPPGHHAEAHTAMGFCVFNTCAIAAAHARKSLNCRRVLIVDWDIHHGNGIQHMFESDPDVLYFSVHR